MGVVISYTDEAGANVRNKVAQFLRVRMKNGDAVHRSRGVYVLRDVAVLVQFEHYVAKLNHLHTVVEYTSLGEVEFDAHESHEPAERPEDDVEVRKYRALFAAFRDLAESDSSVRRVLARVSRAAQSDSKYGYPESIVS